MNEIKVTIVFEDGSEIDARLPDSIRGADLLRATIQEMHISAQPHEFVLVAFGGQPIQPDLTMEQSGISGGTKVRICWRRYVS